MILGNLGEMCPRGSAIKRNHSFGAVQQFYKVVMVKVAIIGAGDVGHCLGKALANKVVVFFPM